MLFTACDDQIMEWGRPAGQQPVTMADIPLAVKEVRPTTTPSSLCTAVYAQHAGGRGHERSHV
jgi:hypothetical protein